MRNLATVLVFLFALVGVMDSVNARTGSALRAEPDAISAQSPLDGAVSADDKDAKKKKKKKKQDDKDEDEEEDVFSYDAPV